MISLSPKSSLSNFESNANEGGNSLNKFSRNSSDVRELSIPKSAGSDVNDISFNPNTVKDFKLQKDEGILGIGFELKSAI